MVSDVILLSASLNARKTVKRFINSIGGKQYSEYSYINCNDHACQHCDKSFHYRGVLSITITINNKKNDDNSWHGTVLSTKQNLDGLSIGMVGFCRWAMGSKVGSLLSHFQFLKMKVPNFVPFSNVKNLDTSLTDLMDHCTSNYTLVVSFSLSKMINIR